MVAPSAYSTRPARIPEERSGVLELWRGSLGQDERMQRKFDWFYSQSPSGTPLTMFLEWRADTFAEPGNVGVATAGRRDFLLGHKSLPASVLVDMAVRSEHRTLGPALQLQKGLLGSALTSVEFVYGFPNARAAPVFQRAGYQRLGMMRRHVRVLRASSYLKRSRPWQGRVAGPLADIALRVGLEVQALFANAPGLLWSPVHAMQDLPPDDPEGVPSNLLRGARTREFLRWRFAPAHGAQCMHVVPVGCTPGSWWIVEGQGEVLQVRDCAPGLLAESRRRHWMALFRDALRRGYHSVSFECLAPSAQLEQLVALGMRVRGERPVFWASLPERSAALGESPWFLTAADEDE